MNKETKITLSTLSVAEGNPAALCAIDKILQSDGFSTDRIFLQASAIPPKVFHLLMTKFTIFSRKYSSNDEGVRSLGLKVCGLISLVEYLAQRSFLLTKPENRALIAVQEHQLGMFPVKMLDRFFPQGRYLFIPDVEPKGSAVEIMKEKKVTPLVWNEQAYSHLRKIGLDPVLTQPVLPQGFMEKGQRCNPVEDYVLVKSSGSGMPKDYVARIRKDLKELGYDYKLYLPHSILTEEGYTSRSYNLVERIAEFYSTLINHPPRLIISYPSEMIQVSAYLGILGSQFLALPTRGSHEIFNQEWGIEKRSCAGTVNPRHADSSKIIQAAYEVKGFLGADTLGLGIMPINGLFMT